MLSFNPFWDASYKNHNLPYENLYALSIPFGMLHITHIKYDKDAPTVFQSLLGCFSHRLRNSHHGNIILLSIPFGMLLLPESALNNSTLFFFQSLLGCFQRNWRTWGLLQTSSFNPFWDASYISMICRKNSN